jgi:hypothetical protein
MGYDFNSPIQVSTMVKSTVEVNESRIEDIHIFRDPIDDKLVLKVSYSGGVTTDGVYKAYFNRTHTLEDIEKDQLFSDLEAAIFEKLKTDSKVPDGELKPVEVKP